MLGKMPHDVVITLAAGTEYRAFREEAEELAEKLRNLGYDVYVTRPEDGRDGFPFADVVVWVGEHVADGLANHLLDFLLAWAAYKLGGRRYRERLKQAGFEIPPDPDRSVTGRGKRRVMARRGPRVYEEKDLPDETKPGPAPEPPPRE
jgi:hypothetical protein